MKPQVSDNVARYSLPPVVGHMEILPGVTLNLTRKPKWFYRLTTRLLLGWKWRDAEPGE